MARLVNHAELTDKHLDSADKRIEALRQSQLGINEGVQGLVGAIRQLIDRIPPENLR